MPEITVPQMSIPQLYHFVLLVGGLTMMVAGIAIFTVIAVDRIKRLRTWVAKITTRCSKCWRLKEVADQSVLRMYSPPERYIFPYCPRCETHLLER